MSAFDINQTVAEFRVVRARVSRLWKDTPRAAAEDFDDMRSPLATILATAEHLRALNAGDQVSEAAQRLVRSGRSINALLSDLMDFNRNRLGLSIRVEPQDVDLARLAELEIDQIRAAHPGRTIELSLRGDLFGRFDAVRMQ